VSTLTVAFIDRFSPKYIGTDVRNPKSKNEFVGGTSHHPFPHFAPQKFHFRPGGPENPYKY